MPEMPEARLATLRDLESEIPSLSAVDVRRRGDVRRRRRHAVVATGAAAVVALVAGGVLVLTPGDQRTAPDPAVESPTPSPSAEQSPLPTTIPDDVPLAAGFPDVNEDGSPVEVTSAPGVEAIEMCGESVLGAEGSTDVAGVGYLGGEDYRFRTLLLFGSEAEAQERVTNVAEIVSGCPSQTTDDGTLLIEPVESGLGGGTFAFAASYENTGPLTSATSYHLVPIGNQVLITSQGGETGNTAASLRAGAQDAEAQTAELIAVLAGGVEPPEPTETSAPTSPTESPATDTTTVPALPSTTAIPATLPLDSGLPAADASVTVTAPSADGEDIADVDPCRARVWPPEGAPVDRLITSATGPEYFEARELLVYANATEAQADLNRVRDTADACGRDGTRQWDRLDVTTGYDSVTMGLSYTDSLGSGVYQFTRVGAALLLVHTSGEGSREGLPAAAKELTTTTRTLATELCPFTAAGC